MNKADDKMSIDDIKDLSDQVLLDKLAEADNSGYIIFNKLQRDAMREDLINEKKDRGICNFN